MIPLLKVFFPSALPQGISFISRIFKKETLTQSQPHKTQSMLLAFVCLLANSNLGK